MILKLKTIYTAMLLMISCIFNPLNLLSQGSEQTNVSREGRWFFYWGYNRSIFSTTNLHFNGPNYDFTLYDLEATDRPSKLGLMYINPVSITTPQYNIRAGYFITDRLSVSGGMDHMKYVITPGQWTRISGVINSEASPKYAGSYLNQPIQLTADLLQFEHTNGYNLATIDFEYLFPIAELPARQLKFVWNTGLGGIWVVAKTDVRVFGDGLDNDFHIAGYALAGKMGPRLEFRNKFFLLAECKAHYSSLTSVLIKNAAPEVGDHKIESLEFYAALGFMFGRTPAKKSPSQ